MCSNSKAARRWHLAYTLLHNPDLLPRRKLALLLTRGMESEEDDDKPHACSREMMPVRSSKRRVVRDGWIDEQVDSYPINHVHSAPNNPELPELRIESGTRASHSQDVRGYGSMGVGLLNPSFDFEQDADAKCSNPKALSYI